MKPKTFLVILVLAFTTIQNVFAQRQVQPNIRQANPVLDFTDAALKFSEHAPIELKNNSLDWKLLDREVAYAACREIVGGLGGSGSSQGGNGWSCYSNSAKLRVEMGNSFELDRFLRAQRNPGKSALLLGLQTPFQKTSINQSQSELLAFHIDTGNSRVFWMKATPTKVFLVNLDEASAQSWTDVSWESLNSKHDLLSLCDSLRDVGINLPKTVPWSDTATLIRDLIVFTESDWEEFMLEFAGLNSAKFEKRNEASGKLALETEKWPVAIAWGMLSSKTPPEVKSRLRTAVAAEPGKKINHLISTVVSELLHESPAALIRILETPPEPDAESDNEPVFAQLRKVTGQEIGNELDAWKSWRAKSGSLSAKGNDEADASPAINLGGQPREEAVENGEGSPMFDSAKVEFSNLLSLTVDQDGFWKLDRDAWSAHFGGRTATELIDGIRATFKETGLPAGWLDIGKGYDPKCIGYPQILFEKYTESLLSDAAQQQGMQMARIRQNQMQIQMNRMQRGGLTLMNSLNRDYDAGELKVKLTMSSADQVIGGKVVPEEFFDLELLDNSAAGRTIHFREELDHSLKLFCMGSRQKKILGLGQKANGECWIHLIESDQVKTVEAPDARTLLAGNKEWFESSVKPMFAELGIGLGFAAGGPIQIDNERPIE